MSVTSDPQASKDVAAFGTANNPAAAINYEVPLPGSYSLSRMQPIDTPRDWFTKAAQDAGIAWQSQGIVTESEAARTIDAVRLREWLLRRAPIRLPVSLSTPGATGAPATPTPTPTPTPTTPQTVTPVRFDAGTILREQVIDSVVLSTTAANLPGRPVFVQVPLQGLAQSVRLQPVELKATAQTTPRITLVETFQLSSFLGDYGLGRTLQTYSLLPGEKSRIAVETWRESSSSREESTSVFDSSDTSAQSRFTNAVERETGSSSSDAGTWASSLSGNAGGGFSFFGLFGASGGVQTYDAATSQYNRQSFSNAMSRATSEHASQVNNSRQQSVQTASSSTSSQGGTEGTVRELQNINLRRVLNFVFRELNQEYETVTSLRDIRVAFYNGNEGSARIVALAELRTFLEEVIVPEHRETVARTILSAIAECVDENDDVQPMLQRGTRNGGKFTWTNAVLDGAGKLAQADPVIDPKYAWRIAPGPIGQGDAAIRNKVPGVVIARSTIVLRTDNVVIEALLGQADALDPYATAVQALDLRIREADINARDASTKQQTAALALVQGQPAKEQVSAWEKVLGEKPDIEVVPLAAAQNGVRP